MATSKKPTIQIDEILHQPFVEDPQNPVPEFQAKEGVALPLFSDVAIVELQEFHMLAREIMATEDIVVFWGLSGLLQNMYSTIKVTPDNMLTTQTVEAQIRLAKPNQVMNLYRSSGFEVALERLGDIETLTQIPYAEALLILEGRKLPPGPKYEDAEEDEFDENCLPTCLPGDHKCGKK